MKLNLSHTFTEELPADSSKENSRRQVFNACYSLVNPTSTSNPQLIHYSTEVAELLGINESDIQSDDFLNIFTGNKVLNNTTPYAMCYGGHQFGHWAGQLGDGRAINLFQVKQNDKLWSVQLKGAGPTPYSRNADGLAVLRSSIREYLCSEAMHHLGVPTTRAFTLSLSGDKVLRDMLYDGHPEYEKGAIVSRVAPSFLRFGSYEIFTSRNEIDSLKQLVDYTIKHHFPEVKSKDINGYIHFFNSVVNRTLKMLIEWQRVGFVHGVMNTDNMSILGLTIDYGPYGWLDDYNFDWTPNTTDKEHKRYRFGNQPNIALWNLLQLANALYPLINDVKPFEITLNQFKIDYDKAYYEMMCHKIGLFTNNDNDIHLIKQLERLMHLTETDMTIFFRLLSTWSLDSNTTDFGILKKAFYQFDDMPDSVKEQWKNWFVTYTNRLMQESLSPQERLTKMNAINPKYVLRNYMAQLCIDQAEVGNYSLLNELFDLLKHPYDEQIEHEKWFAKRPDWAKNKAGSSMLSCSS